MLALAHHLQRAIDGGRHGSAADIAGELGLSRNRIATVLRLTALAPDIQDEVLSLESIDGEEPTTERWLFETLATEVAWAEQRRRWAARSVTEL